MLNIDNIAITAGDIVIAGSVEIAGTPTNVTITLPPDLRLTLDQLNAIAGTGGPESVDTRALEAATEANDRKTTAILNVVSANKPA